MINSNPEENILHSDQKSLVLTLAYVEKSWVFNFALPPLPNPTTSILYHYNG